jgi:hypothetical protein
MSGEQRPQTSNPTVIDKKVVPDMATERPYVSSKMNVHAMRSPKRMMYCGGHGQRITSGQD